QLYLVAARSQYVQNGKAHSQATERAGHFYVARAGNTITKTRLSATGRSRLAHQWRSPSHGQPAQATSRQRIEVLRQASSHRAITLRRAVLMDKLLKYRGYYGSLEASTEDNCLFGKLQFIRALVSYEGETVAELEAAFREAVDDY